jgi:hypothetical protein
MRRHDNRDRSRGSHGGFDCWDKMGDDYIDAKPDQLFSKLLRPIAAPLGIAELDLDVLAFRIAEGVQAAPESISKRMRRRGRHQHANIGQFPRLLRTRCERPRSRRAAEQRNEITTFHVCPLGRDTRYHMGAVLCITANLAADWQLRVIFDCLARPPLGVPTSATPPKAAVLFTNGCSSGLCQERP